MNRNAHGLPIIRQSIDGRRATNRAGDRLTVVYRAISELKSDPNNPRRHSQKQTRQIARSIEHFGFNAPVLVDANLKIIAGHGRVLACQELRSRRSCSITSVKPRPGRS